MPKQKTKKAVRKRFKVTKTGKVLRSKASRRHLLAGKPSKKKRQMRGWHVASETDFKRVKRSLPYG